MSSPSTALKEWMKENGYETKTLAQRLNFNAWSIYKFLDDDRPASWELRHRFAVVFGMEKAKEIFGDVNVESIPA